VSDIDITERLRGLASSRHMDRSQDEMDAAMVEAADIIARFKSERSFVIGFNEGWDEAMERAAQIADVQSVLFEKQAAHTDDGLVHDALVMASDACELVACEIRHAGKDGGAACGKPVDGDP